VATVAGPSICPLRGTPCVVEEPEGWPPDVLFEPGYGQRSPASESQTVWRCSQCHSAVIVWGDEPPRLKNCPGCGKERWVEMSLPFAGFRRSWDSHPVGGDLTQFLQELGAELYRHGTRRTATALGASEVALHVIRRYGLEEHLPAGGWPLPRPRRGPR
jgi:hypothetical protein